MELKRICRECGKELQYKSKEAFYLGKKVNSVCRSCAQKKNAKIGGDLSVLLNDTYDTFYWVGFILADGSITKNRLSFSLQEKDGDQVHKFAKYIKYTNSFNFGKKQVRVSIKDSINIPKLCDKFDILKSKTYNPPDTIKKFPIDFQYCLLAGFIDGDGCIKKNNNRKDFTLVIKNHKSWYNILSEFNELISDKNMVRINNAGYASLIITDSTKLKVLKSKILSYDLPIMQRKWDKIDLNFESKYVKAEQNKKSVIIDLQNGLSINEIAIKNNLSYSGVYRIKIKYYDMV